MATKKPTDYTALRAELDEILASLGDDTLDVDAMTHKYQRGMEIVQLLEDYLRTAENKIHKIKATFDAPT
jgi:exodeoxyribonuclease VII small subunit